MKVPRSIGTHDGQFHADEVTAAALLILFDLADQDKIIRTRDPERLGRCEFVCDVGGIYDPKARIFDHHQLDYDGKLSSAGMILQYLKDERILDEEGYRFFNEMLIIGVDDHDNGRAQPPLGHQSFSNVVSTFNPPTYDSEPVDQEHAFKLALQFVVQHLHRMWERFEHNRSCREAIADRMAEDKTCLMFDESLPWLENFFYLGGEQHPATFLIMPKGEHWKLRGIPPNLENRMAVRVSHPQSWLGLMDEELKGVTGIDGAIFCHKGGFISVWETKEAAVEAMEMIVGRNDVRV